MSDRKYQNEFKSNIYEAWSNGQKNVLGVMPTGGGKSHTMGEIVRDLDRYVNVIAHRKELINQLSMALARQGVAHDVIADKTTTTAIQREQYDTFNACLINHNSPVVVVGVDTLIARKNQLSTTLKRAGAWIIDEAHHIQTKNKWGSAVALMPQALGLGLTATPCRADGGGLGAHASGVFNDMVLGPSMRTLIDSNYLTDYRIFVPESDVDYTNVEQSSTGDYKQPQLVKAVKNSQLVGDVVDSYLKIAKGKRGITFTVDIESAEMTAAAFNAAGVPAAAISSKTPLAARQAIMAQFRTGKLLQLCNCDLFGEGVDVPAVEVVSMARRTLSYSLFAQQFGRALRIDKNNPDKIAIIIDHAHNVLLHGLPDSPRVWTLDDTKGTPRSVNPDDDIQLTYCVKCTQPRKITKKQCPYCGHIDEPINRTELEFVDGDLYELDPETLRKMREELAQNDLPGAQLKETMKRAGAPAVVYNSAAKQRDVKLKAQKSLRLVINWFFELQRRVGMGDDEILRTFYFLFSIDVMSAQALGKNEAYDLANKINNYIGLKVNGKR